VRLEKMSYQYEWKHISDFSGVVPVAYASDPDAVKTDLSEGCKQLALEAFAAEIAKVGRTLRIDSADVLVENFRFGSFTPEGVGVGARVTVTVVFTTDIPEKAESLGIMAFLTAVGSAFLILWKTSLIFRVIILVIAVFVVSVGFRITGTSIWTPLTPTGGGEWLTMIIVIIVLLFVLGLLPTILTLLTGRKKGKKAKK
jgi:hypothetical protein